MSLRSILTSRIPVIPLYRPGEMSKDFDNMEVAVVRETTCSFLNATNINLVAVEFL